MELPPTPEGNELDKERQALESNLNETGNLVKEIEEYDPTLIDEVKAAWQKVNTSVLPAMMGAYVLAEMGVRHLGLSQNESLDVTGSMLVALGLGGAAATALLAAGSFLQEKYAGGGLARDQYEKETGQKFTKK